MAKRIALIGLGLMSMAAGGTPAAPGPSAPSVPGTQAVQPIVHITRILNSNYSSGAYSAGVELINKSATTVSGVKVTMKRPGKALNTSFTVSITPNSAMTVSLTDPEGLESGCSDQSYTFQLEGAAGAPVDTRLRKATVHPSCTFTGTVENPWATATDDHVAGLTKGKLTVDPMVISSPNTNPGHPTAILCHQSMTFKGHTNNLTTKDANPLLYRLKDDHGQPVASTLMKVPAKDGKDILMTGNFPGGVGRWLFEALDPNHSLGTDGIYDQQVHFVVTRACSLTVALEN